MDVDFDLDIPIGGRRGKGGEGIFLLVLIIIVVVLVFIFSVAESIGTSSSEEFKEAKKTGKQITCRALLKTHVVDPKNYTIYDKHIEVKTLLWKKSFQFSKCHIESVTPEVK